MIELGLDFEWLPKKVKNHCITEQKVSKERLGFYCVPSKARKYPIKVRMKFLLYVAQT